MNQFSPIIFTLYTADLELWLKYCKVYGYADDTTTSCWGRNITLNQGFGANLKKPFLLNFATNFSLFGVFLAFQHKKHWKCIFLPAFGVPSTQMLVKIYNTQSVLFSLCSALATAAEHFLLLSQKGLSCRHHTEQCTLGDSCFMISPPQNGFS